MFVNSIYVIRQNDKHVYINYVVLNCFLFIWFDLCTWVCVYDNSNIFLVF